MVFVIASILHFIFLMLVFSLGFAQVPEGAVQIKSSVLNVRSSPGSLNSSNLVRGCQVKKGMEFRPSDFEFVNGIPWCKVHLSGVAGCEGAEEGWIAGSSAYLDDGPDPVDPLYTEEDPRRQTEAGLHCPDCGPPTPGLGLQWLPDPMMWNVNFGPPLPLRPCEGESCNCRGLSSNWGHRVDPVLGGETRYHRGIDLAAPSGTPILAVADGVVVAAAARGRLGLNIEIQHFDGFRGVSQQLEKDESGQIIGAAKDQAVKMRACGIVRSKKVESISTSYSHLSKIADGISYGTVVRKGDVIGYVGTTGRSTAPHLHFEVSVVGMDCQDGNRSGDTCSPRLFHDFPEWTRSGTTNFRCEPATGANR